MDIPSLREGGGSGGWEGEGFTSTKKKTKPTESMYLMCQGISNLIDRNLLVEIISLSYLLKYLNFTHKLQFHLFQKLFTLTSGSWGIGTTKV